MLFLSTLSLRRATRAGWPSLSMRSRFLSTLSLRRATNNINSSVHAADISIHALLAESDDVVAIHCQPMVEFLSTLSLRRATVPGSLSAPRPIYFYPRSPCGERQDSAQLLGQLPVISIHALLAESDDEDEAAAKAQAKFLSTLSLRRATSKARRRFSSQRHFYPRSPCGERRGSCPGLAGGSDFYPRSPCGERPVALVALAVALLFLSTLSLRRATGGAGDPGRQPQHFYPRSPCGERLEYTGDLSAAGQFLSTLSLRRATTGAPRPQGRHKISIHALLAESDLSLYIIRREVLNFYPRSPCGERLWTALLTARRMIFLSTLSLRRAT